MSCSRNILWNLAYPLTVNRVQLSASLTLICWHLRLGCRLGAFRIHTIRWRHSRLAPLTVTVSVAFRNVSTIWTNVGKLYWRIYASLGLNDLILLTPRPKYCGRSGSITQCHGCWWLGSLHHQVISSNGIDYQGYQLNSNQKCLFVICKNIL